MTQENETCYPTVRYYNRRGKECFADIIDNSYYDENGNVITLVWDDAIGAYKEQGE